MTTDPRAERLLALAEELCLNERQRVFCERLTVHGEKQRAAKEAGAAPKSAASQASDWLKLPKVKSYLQALKEIATQEALAETPKGQITSYLITQDRVLLEAGVLAFSDVRHYVVDENGYLALAPGAPDDAMRAVSSVKRKMVKTKVGEAVQVSYEVEFKLWDKPGMVKLTGRHVGLFPDKVERGKEERPVQVAEVLALLPPDALRAIGRALLAGKPPIDTTAKVVNG